MPASLRDVAKRAQVSVATVSHVVTGRRHVSEPLRLRVRAAIQELGYRPNGAARSLKLRTSSCLGLIISDITNPFFPELARGVEDAAREAGYSVFLCNTDDRHDAVRQHVEVLRERLVDGLIFTSATDEDVPLLRELQEAQVPFILANRRVAGVDSDFVGIDNQAGAALAARHLLVLGHERIAVIAGPENSSASRDRLHGLVAALREAGLEPTAICHGPLRYDAGFAAARELFQAATPPTAVFAGNDLIALGVVDAARSQGLSVPEDVTVVGFDDMAFAHMGPLRLTTVHQPRYELGRAAVQLLLERLRDPAAPRQESLLPVRLVVRESSARPHAGDARRGERTCD